MAFKTIKEQKIYEIDTLSHVDQNGHYKRNPDGSIMMQKDAEGNDLPFPVSKAGIAATPDRLVPRTASVKGPRWKSWPDDKYYPNKVENNDGPSQSQEPPDDDPEEDDE